MEAKELRLGNWVSGSNDPDMVIVSITDVDVELRFYGVDPDYGDWYYLIEQLKPIPLDEGWLKKFGFDNNKPMKSAKEWHDENGVICLLDKSLFVSGFYKYNTIESHVIIRYVHQLQNLYFALTGTELTIKE